MYKFGRRSQANLNTCNEDIQKVMNEAIKTSSIDFSILQGSRGEKEQNEYYNSGMSQVKYPNSKHNSDPSNAIDLVPYPVDWKDIQRFKDLSKHILSVAEALNIPLFWGGNWENFKDYPHYEV